MRVKILELSPNVSYSDDYNQTFYTVSDSTNWDEVTEEEYSILLHWAQLQTDKFKSRIVIVKESELSPPKVIKEYLEYIKQEQERQKIKNAEADAKALKSKKAREEKALEKKKKQLEKLKQELGE